MPSPPAGLVNHPKYRGWTRTFHDDFPGTALDTAKWGANPGGETAWGAKRNEGAAGTVQVYQSSNVTVANGVCTITVQAESPPINWNGTDYHYSSGFIHTHGNFAQRYGYWEIECKLPDKVGTWPAAWGLKEFIGTSNYVWEQDWFEGFGVLEAADDPDASRHGKMNGDRIRSTVHYNPGTGMVSDGSAYEPGPPFSRDYFTEGFHVFAMEWLPTHIAFFIDGVEWKRITDPIKIPTAVDDLAYININCDVGDETAASGNIAETDADLPVTYEIKRVSVWQHPDYLAVA